MPYLDHPHLNQISSEQVLFRYMHFSKYVSMLQNKALYFPSLIQLDASDPWEGHHSKLNFIDQTAHKISLPSGDFLEWNRSDLSKSAESSRKNLFVNCWHMNNNESDAQWRIYGDSIDSLAIVSTKARLGKAITDQRKIYGTKIHYYDPCQEVTPVGNILYPVSCKRSAFSHEREFRLIYWNLQGSSQAEEFSGLITVDLKEMIERVVVSPRAEKWFVKVIEELTFSMGLSFCITQSDLLAPYSPNTVHG